MIGWRSKKIHSSRGFTLIEVIVTMALFSMTVLMAVTLLVVFIQQQRRAVSQEQLQNDIRAVMERMTTELREGRVDFNYYKTNYPSDTLFNGINGQNIPLVLVDVLNNQIWYKKIATPPSLQRCVMTVTDDCSLAGDWWEDISPTTLQIQALQFAISPSEDPFANQTPEICSDPGGDIDHMPTPSGSLTCRWGTTCSAIDKNGVTLNECALVRGSDTALNCYCVPQQLNGLSPLHPRVTFSIQAQRTVGQNTVSDIFQTTVASRLFQNIERLNQYAP